MADKPVEKCEVHGCPKNMFCKKFCVKHYTQYKKYGNPQMIRKRKPGDKFSKYWIYDEYSDTYSYPKYPFRVVHKDGRVIIVEAEGDECLVYCPK